MSTETVRAITTDNRGRLVALTETIDTTNQQIAALQVQIVAFQANVNQQVAVMNTQLSNLQLLALQIQQSLG